MPVDWRDGGPDLLVEVRHDRGALGRQIQDQLRAAIRDGRLAPGERLPSSRRLATSIGVSRGTVVDAYEQLWAEGYVESTVGSGTRVADVPPSPAAPSEAAPLAGPAAPAAPAPARPTAAARVHVDFEYGVPDLASVPLGDWLWAISEATRRLPTAALGDEDPAGSWHLREVVTAYHRRVRAGVPTADRAVIVVGFRQGLAFTLATLAQHGYTRIGLEDPGPREHDVIARRAGLEPVPVPVDHDGLDVDGLRASGARVVLSTPAHQCPTGVVLGPARRRELVAWAADVDGVVLEDDYDAEFRYDRQPVGSLQGLDPERVVALGSVSKTLAPAIKLGWVFSPARFVDGIVDEKRLTSRGAPALDQEALAILIESGRFDRHLRRVRDVYRRRRDVLAAEVAAAFPDGSIQGLAAGCHVLLRLPEGVPEHAVVDAARSSSVRVYGLTRYRLSHDPPHRPALVLGFGNVTESQIQRGVRALAQAVATAARPSDPRASQRVS
jgi:GntR family transcriptional regulator/MocR family aminotransferase